MEGGRETKVGTELTPLRGWTVSLNWQGKSGNILILHLSKLGICQIAACYIANKWKNHFFKMKGDIGMGWSTKKEGNKEWLLSKPHRTT